LNTVTKAITASALLVCITDAESFDNGRQLAAWLGLVPRQYSSMGKAHLLGISKRGDADLRTLLIRHGRDASIDVGMPFVLDNSAFRKIVSGHHSAHHKNTP
jgi:transposase